MVDDLKELLVRVAETQEIRKALLKLPLDIFIDIVSRLPIKPLTVCRSVCKSWLTIVHHPDFTKMHTIRVMSQPPHSTSSLLFHSKNGGDVYLLEHADKDTDDANDDTENGVAVNTQLKFDVKLALIGSCHGLVCLTIASAHNPIYVCNPVIGECIKAPWSWMKSFHVVSGFGFDEVKNEYKVIRMQYEEDDKLVAEIFTLGSGQWRELGDVPYLLRGNKTQVFINGALHWQLEESISVTPSKFVVAFDVGREEFRVIHHPPIQSFLSFLGDLGGNLCLLNGSVDDGGYHYQVWVMKEYGVDSSWTKEYVISGYVHGIRNFGNLCPLMLLPNGNILLFHNCEYLICYNPTSEGYNQLWIPQLPQCNDAVPYVGSFISPWDIVGATNRNCSVTTGKWYGTLQQLPIHPQETLADDMLKLLKLLQIRVASLFLYF